MSNSEQDAQDIIRAWLQRVLASKDWKPHRLAKEAGVSPATISRALNDDSFTTSTTTIEKIVRATGVPAPTGIGMMVPNSKLRSFAEPEAEYVASPQDITGSEQAGQQATWKLSSRALDLAGYLPGDLLIVDPTISPVARDIVCVQIYSREKMSAETVFRVFDPPYVVTRSTDPAAERKPLLIDQERASIWGTVIKVVRIRGTK